MDRDRGADFPLGAALSLTELSGDPHQALAELRQHEPVSWLPALSGWLVTSHQLAEQVMRDAAGFTVDDPRFSTAQVVGPSMLSLDGAEHARHRAPFAAAFRPAAVSERFQPMVAAHCERLVGELAGREQAELRAELAGPLAVAVLADVLGMADADPATVLGWYCAIVAAVSAITAGEPVDPAADRAVAELAGQVAATLTGAPASLLAGSAAAGLATDEVVSNAAVLMFGGIDTTEGMIANLLWHLLSVPSRWSAVLADPRLIPAAIEESLRLEPAAAVIDRYATRPVVLAGAPIRAGDLVRVSITAANRDSSVFDNPNAFEFERANRSRQLAFARGPHFCIGMELARLQARTVLARLASELPGLRLVEPSSGAPTGLVFRKPAEVIARWR